MTGAHRILVMAHGHPDFSLGGGELAAYRLFQGYRASASVDDAWFLGRADRGRGIGGQISRRREREYLWEQGVHDWHAMSAVHRESLATWFTDLVRALKPTIVHTHHYAHLGLEYLRVIKNIDPSIRLFLTLHEYMAICRNNGQMIKTGDFKLCSRESFDECHRCFPQASPEDFWLRKHGFQRHFDLVDGFIAPSEFLRQRYIDWGLAPERIVVIENGQADEPALPPRPLRAGEARNRFGFFGQINPYKGLDVVLEAVSQLPADERARLRIEVHGANLEQQAPDFRDRIETLRDALVQEGVVQWVGPYAPEELRGRMAGLDWVLVPSIWWENSPMVIQEAFVHGRPVICSNIGGMAEKVRAGVDGLHVRAGNRLHWGETLVDAAADAERWNALVQGIRRPLTVRDGVQAHLAAFARFGRPAPEAASAPLPRRRAIGT